MTEPPPPPPTGPPPPPAYPPGSDPQRRPPAVSVGLAALGVLAVVPLSFLLIFALEGDTELGVRAGIFAGLVFLGGGALCFVRSPLARGFGIGLMTGWALLSITTAGVCTGLQRFIL